ncbi:CvpA family protein [Salinisphaera sp. USBA-960]|uniref:CvpA family protein n=1 Tax=Salinisphaera orenii TaxID=856731 RepID=UPI000DBE4033|nr:CvpA family protein [Salifodinibacter halophilus]NNC26110.1 CvpA family protein [Salifodinibacter halophilus]
MNWVDAAIILIVALSAGVGFFRGFGREVFGLAIWILAFYLAFNYATELSVFLASWIDTRTPRLVAAFGVIFVAVVVLGAIVNVALGRLIDKSGLGGTDRILGVGFGFIRGVALLVFLVLLAGMTSIPQDGWWQRSLLMTHLESGALKARPYLPPDLADSVSYPERAAKPSSPRQT